MDLSELFGCLRDFELEVHGFNSCLKYKSLRRSTKDSFHFKADKEPFRAIHIFRPIIIILFSKNVLIG